MTALIEQALQIDPDDAVALAYMANVHRHAMTAALAARRLTAAERATEANRYLRRAIAADPNDAVAIELLADYERRYAWDWREAETLFRRALALDPNNVQAHANYGYLLATVGRCVEGLQHGRISAALDPEFIGRQLIVPRLLPCIGERARARSLYQTYLAREPANLFLLREVYINTLIQGDAPGLRDLAHSHRVTATRSGALTPELSAALDRTAAAADALEGRPGTLLGMVEAEVAASIASEAASSDRAQAFRLDADHLWTLAAEFAWAGRAERALDMLERGVAEGSLYLPPLMPGAETEFPPAVRNHPRYIALWRADPRMAELVRLRMAAVRAGQMRGRRPE